MERWKIVEPRTSMYDAQISDNDKSLIIKGFYMPYLRRVYNRSKNKDLVIVYMDGDDDRFNAYLKQLDECQQKFTECYIVLLVTQINEQTYVKFLEEHALLNKFNIVCNRNEIGDRVFQQNQGKAIVISWVEPYYDVAKFQQALGSKYNEKKPTSPDIYLNSRRLDFIQQVYEKHRKQVTLICSIPKDEQTIMRLQ